MLSYQHAYHAGNKADLQKHALLCRVLETLTRKERPLTYMETHAGRGLYDLGAAEALKTGEAAQGWLEISKNEKALQALPSSYVEAVRAVNGGALAPAYPGSPLIAAHGLRAQDQLHLMELHPQEHAALEQVFKKDKRVHIHKRDGLEGVLALSPPEARRGLVLIDPSYEVKSEYETIPDFVIKLIKKWPETCVLVWVPMLPAKRHEGMVERMKKDMPGAQVFETIWGKPGEGMYGSLMVGMNLPYGV